MTFSSFVLPSITVLIIIFGLIKKIDVFSCFTQGAKQGAETVFALLPVLTALMTAVTMLKASGATDIITDILSPLSELAGIPREVVPLCILSPVSGSGSLTVFENIIGTYGPDSLQGRIASVIAGSTETTFYAVTVYLGSVGIKKTGVLIPCALLGDTVSFICAAMTVKYFFA